MKSLLIITFITILLLGFSIYTYSQNSNYKKDKTLTIAFYNVENLFDTINNPQKADTQFLPKSKKKMGF